MDHEAALVVKLVGAVVGDTALVTGPYLLIGPLHLVPRCEARTVCPRQLDEVSTRLRVDDGPPCVLSEGIDLFAAFLSYHERDKPPLPDDWHPVLSIVISHLTAPDPCVPV